MPTAEQLYQLVAPIALFPDNLLAQVLAASTYPDQVSAAYTWLQQNSSLKGSNCWTRSISSRGPKCEGPDAVFRVLQQMATSLSWTSALGDAYFIIPRA